VKYAVALERAAARFLLRLKDAKLKKRLDDAIQVLSDDPRPPACRKLAGTSDRYLIRVGDNRSEA
jgi:mRNA-degrading endonuclease RelE of RelBE toxin-antitoxin system